MLNFRKLGIRLTLILMGLIIGLALTEIGLRFIPENQLSNLIFHSARGRHLYTINEDVGWVLKPNLDTTWETRDLLTLKLTTNSHGLRDVEITYEKNDGDYRILLLGDSFAEALQVDLADAFPTTLETCLTSRYKQEVQVINAGVTAYGLGEEYLFYKTEGVKYDPDLVLISIFTGNDLSDLDRHDRFIMIRIAGGYRFDLLDGQLQKRWLSWEQPEEPISRIEQSLRRNSLVYKFLRHPDSKLSVYLDENFKSPTTMVTESKPSLPSWEFFVHADNFAHNPKTPPILIDRWSVFETLVMTLKNETLQRGQKLAFVLIPNKQQAHRRFRVEKIMEFAEAFDDLDTVTWNLEKEPNKTIANFLIDQNLPVLDLLPFFQAHDAAGKYDLYYENDLHFNREGHYLTSELLCDWLSEENLVPQN